MVVNKATDHFKHKAEKQKVIRAAEKEPAKDVDITRIKSQVQTYKDEILILNDGIKLKSRLWMPNGNGPWPALLIQHRAPQRSLLTQE